MFDKPAVDICPACGAYCVSDEGTTTQFRCDYCGELFIGGDV